MPAALLLMIGKELEPDFFCGAPFFFLAYCFIGRPPWNGIGTFRPRSAYFDKSPKRDRITNGTTENAWNHATTRVH